MSYTVADYVRETTQENLHTLSIGERLAGLSLPEVLPTLPLEPVLQSWSQGHSLPWLSLEEILSYFSPEAITGCLAKLKTQSVPMPDSAGESQATCGTLAGKSTEVPQEQFEYFLMINWHRLFGMALIDLFTHSEYQVDLGFYTAMKLPFLAMVSRRIPLRESPPAPPLPEGFLNLARHNLLTYKSPSETLNILSLTELVAHYTRYRQQVTGDREQLIAEEEFRLYAISTHYPINLGPLLTKCQEGIYEVTLVHPIQVLVLSQLPKTPSYAFWHLFSANLENVRFGRTHYQWRQPTLSSLANHLLERYSKEDDKEEKLGAPYMVINRMRNYTKEHLQTLTVHERLAGLSPTEVLQYFSPEQRLRGRLPDDIEAYLSKLKSQPSH